MVSAEEHVNRVELQFGVDYTLPRLGDTLALRHIRFEFPFRLTLKEAFQLQAELNNETD